MNISSTSHERSIAILPFVNMSPDPDNEYFSDGITEEIINALTRINGLKVIARTSSFAFKGKAIDVREIGKQLGVNTILEGSVRKASNTVRITAQLVRTDDGSHIWAQNFDRELRDIFALQDEISLLIADQIRENYGHLDIHNQLIESHTQNFDAYNFYLKGRFHQLKWDKENFEQAVSCYEKSIQLDEKYPLPYYGLIQVYAYMASWNFMSRDIGYEKTREYFLAAHRLNNELIEYHFAYVTRSLWVDWNFRLAYKQLEITLEINPQFTEAIEALVELYTAIGEFDKGLAEIDQALILNPLSPNHHYTQGNIFYLSGRYEDAIASMDKALELDREWVLAAQIKSACLIQMKARRKLEQFLKEFEDPQMELDFLNFYEWVHGSQKEPYSFPEHLQEGYLPWEVYYHIYVGEQEVAMQKLKWAVENHIGQYIGFKYDPFLQPIRHHKDFQLLLEKVFHESRLPQMEKGLEQRKTESRAPMDVTEIEQQLSQLSALMKEKGPYLDPKISLKSLAKLLELHPNKLSWLINEQTQMNFNEFINSFRLEAFKKKALDPTNKHLTLLGLAYESGFSSKTVFNAFFKKMEGKTPRAWLNSQ